MRNNPTFRLVFITVLLNLFISHISAQNLANAPCYQASYGSQDYPFNGYALFDIDKDGFRDWIIAKCKFFSRPSQHPGLSCACNRRSKNQFAATGKRISFNHIG